jgi:sulfotransferase family protein
MESGATPSVFHLTHWKAGSQWVREVLSAAAPDRIIPGKDSPTWFFKDPIVPGGIYTPVYANYEQFRQRVPEGGNDRTFALMRDPRDAAVSWYFSLLYSHSLDYETVGATRMALQRLEKGEGLALVVRDQVRHAVGMQRSWIDAGLKLFRYEDLLADQRGVFQQILDHCQIAISEARLRKIVGRYSFRRRTWWRFGQEDRHSHHRKGVAGDWKNHFTGELKTLFKTEYGEALVRAGYEKDDNW